MVTLTVVGVANDCADCGGGEDRQVQRRISSGLYTEHIRTHRIIVNNLPVIAVRPRPSSESLREAPGVPSCCHGDHQHRKCV